MRIDQLWCSQRNLRRHDQIKQMSEDVKEGKHLNKKPLIELQVDERDNEIVINNGHHRVIAIYLAGRKELYEDEYELTYRPKARTRLMNVESLVKMLKIK